MARVGETGQYTGEHSISVRTKVGLGSWSSWFNICTRWHLVPASRPTVKMPELKVNQFDNPGGDGIFDMTESITGFPLFGQRKGSWEFYVLNGWDAWNYVHDSIVNALHGRNVQVILNDDQEWYYNGRLTINEWKSDEARSSIVIDYDFDPYKLSRYQSSDSNYLWDPIRFTSDYVISSIKTNSFTFTANQTITFSANEITRPVTPIFTLIDGVCPRIRFRNPELYGSAYVTHDNLVVGDNHFMNVIMTGFNPGNNNSIQFLSANGVTAGGTMTITYRNGRL